MATMVTMNVQAIVDADVQRRATEILGREGLTVEQAVEQMLNRTVQENGLPFSVEDRLSAMYGEDDPEYDAWFRAKVQEAVDDPRPGIPHEEVRRRMEIRRAEAMARLR